MLLCSMGGDETLRVRAWRSPTRNLTVGGKRHGQPLDPSTLRVRCGLKLTRLKRMMKPALIADKLAFLEWNAKEAQRLASNGDSHGMYCIVRALAGRKTKWSRFANLQRKTGT